MIKYLIFEVLLQFKQILQKS